MYTRHMVCVCPEMWEIAQLHATKLADLILSQVTDGPPDTTSIESKIKILALEAILVFCHNIFLATNTKIDFVSK